MPRAQAWGESIRKKDWDRGFGFYAEIIQEYSWKGLSYPEDVMNAFTGILSALETHSGWNFTHGLPEQLIDWALLWVPAGRHERRPPPQSGPLLQFPSWSWIGWIGPITFNIAFGHELESLRSLLKEVEIETLGENASSFRSLRRIVLDKSVARVDPSFLEAQPTNLLTMNNGSSAPAVSASTLRFTAMVISAAQFQIKKMPSWEWNSAKSSDTAKYEQDGVFITLNDGLVGYFPGTSMKFIGHHQWSRLRLLAMSELEAWDLRDGLAIKHTNNVHEGGQIWEPYRRWAYKLDKKTYTVRTGRNYMVYNVMLVQRRGKFHERVAVGQIDKISWNKGNPVEETILLV
jgi:hypothetical protein